MILYHGTPRENIDRILREGLVSSRGLVYLARTSRSAYEQAYDASFERGETEIPDIVILRVRGLERGDLFGESESFEFDEDVATRKAIPARNISVVR